MLDSIRLFQHARMDVWSYKNRTRNEYIRGNSQPIEKAKTYMNVVWDGLGLQALDNNSQPLYHAVGDYKFKEGEGEMKLDRITKHSSF